ncbi:sigma 54-interacting transcriptional regulator [bacterium]|nr:sigma 54-interacting transcriptional regulator [bacterium]
MNIFDLSINSIRSIWDLLGSYPFLFTVMTFSFTVKLYFVVNLFIHIRKNANLYIRRSCLLLILVLLCAMMANSAWMLKILRRTIFPGLNYEICLLWIHISWVFTIVQYHSLALFIESLVEKNKLFCMRQKILISITGTFFLTLLLFSILSYAFSYNFKKLETILIANIVQYCTFPVLSLSLLLTIRKLRSTKLPRLLRIQARVFIVSMILPFLFFEATNIYPFSLLREYFENANAFAGFATLILLYAIFYCANKIIGLRFLNLKTHVNTGHGFHFINNFRHVLDQFSNITNPQELGHITKTFFKQAFAIPTNKTHLYIRKKPSTSEITKKQHEHEKIIDTFLKNHKKENALCKVLKPNTVFLTDELIFNKFYSTEKKTDLALTFLKQLNADIFIPIVESDDLIGYIIIDRFARETNKENNEEFYTETECDYMLVFSDYLKNILILLHDRNFDTLLHHEKTLEEQIYFKHQEINQYKESIRSFLHTSYEKEIGIIFYKNRHFTFGNRSAQELIKIDLNTQSGHPITKKIKALAKQVLDYKTSKVELLHLYNDKKLVICGIPNIEQKNVIITVYLPEISDLLRKKIELLHDPSDWSFLLSLETTKTGNTINQLIPGQGENLLNFKINLLKSALGKNAILLDVPEGDLTSIVDLLHHTGFHENLHKIHLDKPSKDNSIAIHLFGTHKLLKYNNNEKPILEKLHNGTLFIQNIHFLDLETQEHLSELINHGIYRKLKSDHKIPSSIRIICSTNKNLYDAVQEGTFSKTLFNKLNKNLLKLKSLTSFASDELEELIQELTKRAIKKDAFGNLLGLTAREKQKLLNTHPASLQELKIKIKHRLVEKSKKNQLEQEEELFDPSYTISDPDLIEASQLGKHALRDPKIMELLWRKFKNQNKIAVFLGVNRSSVNRRCKKYGLT